MPVHRSPRARVSAALMSSRRVRGALAALVVLLALPVFASQANAALPLTPEPTFTFVNDENGADDQPGQKDLSAHAVANPPGNLWVSWKWDVTSLSGGNTGDACALFDTDADSRVNFAICVTIAGNPAVQSGVSPRVYTCGDGKVDRCTSTYTQISPINSSCLTRTTGTNTDDPFHSGQRDTVAVCHIDLADVGGAGTTQLINTCSYPSQQPTSAPSDCVLIPRDAFLRIAKVASPSDAGVFPFRLGLTTDAAPPVVFTANGSQTSDYIAIRSDAAYKVKEDIPANWSLSSASCTGATGTGSSNGTRSGDTISGIDASPDNLITCTFNDTRLTGAIQITKQRTGTTTKLAGAEFKIDGGTTLTTGADGTVCQEGLSLGTHSVEETAAPDGHDLDPDNPKSVNVTAAGTCASGATTVTFNNAVVPGTIDIVKTNSIGQPLADAEFTLYADNGTIGGTRGADDTATTLKCTTDADGLCTIALVPLGEYWVVETGVPSGYTAAADQHVTIGVGPSPGVGDSHELTFEDSAAPGEINIHKTGFGGAVLEGAEFTLHVDASPLTAEYDPVNDVVVPGKSCETDSSGDCTISGVAPGDYWLVETITPAGYDTADPTAVTVPLGTLPGQGGSVLVPISDPVVPGTIDIHKTGSDGNELEGATFTLYVDSGTIGGTREATDLITDPVKECTTDADGDCSIASVTPGDYWVVETTTPAGYDTAPDQAVHVGIGAAAHVGDLDELEFVDEVVPGTVSITKKDDANNLLAGAEFTLYHNNAPLGSPRGDAIEDPVTDPALSCETDASGTCDITNVPLGDYWVVETKTPDHYDTAGDEAINVGLGTAAGVGDTDEVSLVDPRQHRVVVLVCHEGTDTLFSNNVTIDGETKASLGGGSLSAAQQKALCDTGGASFGDISGHDPVDAVIGLGGAH
jgi:hypothetical protein